MMSSLSSYVGQRPVAVAVLSTSPELWFDPLDDDLTHNTRIEPVVLLAIINH